MGSRGRSPSEWSPWLPFHFSRSTCLSLSHANQIYLFPGIDRNMAVRSAPVYILLPKNGKHAELQSCWNPSWERLWLAHFAERSGMNRLPVTPEPCLWGGKRAGGCIAQNMSGNNSPKTGRKMNKSTIYFLLFFIPPLSRNKLSHNSGLSNMEIQGRQIIMVDIFKTRKLK